MDESLSEQIDILRKRSRDLLAKSDQNYKKLRNKVHKLYFPNFSLEDSRANLKNKEHFRISRNAETWKLRNDSSAVSGILCPEYFQINPTQTPASMSAFPRTRRILLTSKKCSKQDTKTVLRKPVKGCYCQSGLKTTKHTRSARTQQKQHSPCTCCKSESALRSTFPKEHVDNEILSPPISCETLRRVQRIDYTPTSQFLRNVQSKVSVLRNAGIGDCLESYVRSPCYKFIPGSSIQNAKSRVKRTRAFNKSDAELRTNASDSRSSSKDKSAKTKLKTRENVTPRDSQYYSSDPKNYDETIRGDYKKEREYDGESERLVKDLKKFREQNYFDTHGSSRTLLPSASSGSLEQNLLNERLFPEPIQNIHKKDFVVTMPACVTMQRKRVHYFPRYVVRQEINDSNLSYKKRHQHCPLTGHAIDLGVLKVRPPLNSLALKYQSRLN